MTDPILTIPTSLPCRKTPVNVVRIITRLNVGGPAQHVVVLTAGLNKGRVESTLVTGAIDSHEGDMSFIASANGTPVVRVEGLCNEEGFLGDLKAFWRLFKFIRGKNAKIVDLHLLKARFFGGLAAKVAGVPIIIETFHGNLFDSYFGWFKSAAILAAERFLGWLVVDRVIAISETQKQDLLKYWICPPRKITVIPYGLDLDRYPNCSQFRGELRRELELHDEAVLIGIVGRLVPIKGLSYLLEAVSLVTKATDIDFQLLIVGDGPLHQELEEQSRQLHMEDKVRFLGWRFDLERIYADLDIVALSSLNEGTPFSLIEAMAAGRAVVSTSVGGVPDVVQDEETGLLAPSKNPAALAAAMLRLLKDKDLRKLLGDRARISVLSKYNKSRLLKDMEEFYLRLVAEMD